MPIFERKFRLESIDCRYPYEILIPIENSEGFLHYAEYSPYRINSGAANVYFKNNI